VGQEGLEALVGSALAGGFDWASATRSPCGPRDPLLVQLDRATPIQTHNMKRIFPDIDTDH
jgi:hypothetical protein